MKFLNQQALDEVIQEEVFKVAEEVKKAKEKFGDDVIYNGTIGALYDEEGKFVAFKSVYNLYNQINDEKKAKYSSMIDGNIDYKEAVKKWVLYNNGCFINNQVVATIGGTGAISLAVENFLENGQTLIIPDIGWNNYSLIASKKEIKTLSYNMFEKDNFNLSSFKSICTKVMNNQGKVMVIINDPLHNPTGYSLSLDEWEKIISFINELSKKGEVIILNDIAYSDYAIDINKSKSYIKLFNNIDENVMIVIAFSLSKTLTAYGLRCGAAIILLKDKYLLELVRSNFEITARSIWSNIPNAAMDLFVEILKEENINEYLKEKESYINLLKTRGEIFKNECINNNIDIYPFKEGFFITIKIEDNIKRDLIFKRLKENNIFLIRVNKGIRVGLCGLSIKQCKKLPSLIKPLLS